MKNKKNKKGTKLAKRVYKQMGFKWVDGKKFYAMIRV